MVKFWLWLLLWVGLSALATGPMTVAIASTELAIEYFGHQRNLRSQNLQRAKVIYTDQTHLSANWKATVNTEVVATNANVKQHVAYEEVRDFYVDVRELSIERYLKPPNFNGQLKLGFHEVDNQLFVSRSLSGPGVKISSQFPYALLSTAYYLLPEYEQYYVKDSTARKNSALWSSRLSLPLGGSQNSIPITFGYDYFSQLGVETAYRSRFRNNTVVGGPDNAQFAYDYSIFSLGLSYTTYYQKWKWMPFGNWGINESAFSGENQHLELGLEAAQEDSSIRLSYIHLEKNSLVATYTDESIDLTNVSGGQIQVYHKVLPKLGVRFDVASLQDLDSAEKVNSAKVSATFWGNL